MTAVWCYYLFEHARRMYYSTVDSSDESCTEVN